MRTINPASIKNDFLSAIGDIKTTHAATTIPTIPSKSRKLISEYSFLSAAILLEGYISDLFIAYINRDGSRFSTYLTGKMTIDTKDEYAKRAVSLASIELNKHITTAEIKSIIDDRDFNVTFPETGKMVGAANMWLTNTYATRFTTLTPAQKASLDAIRGIRNFLAHRSKASKDKMQDLLANASLPAPLKRGANKVKDVGSFLESKPQPMLPARINSYLDEAVSLAGIFCP